MLNKLRCIIVDDEKRARTLLQNVLERYCEEVIVLADTDNIQDASKLIQDLKPDLVFLDIEMPGGGGFELLEQFHEPEFDVIFVTAFQEYAIKAIRLAALDYILKPLNIENLQDAVRRATEKKRKGHLKSQFSELSATLKGMPSDNKIVLSNSDEIYSLNFEQIIYCQSAGSYTEFFLTSQKKILTSKNIKEYEEMLLPNNFFRIHKSYMVNMHHIEKVIKSEEYSLLLSNQAVLPLASRRKEAFLTLWNQRN